ncbi:MAG: prolipoprotein diacylglyceryl transferase [Patescibacteria group bacterium]|nr:prolipoprotein diacylglyceryl transferase [Patescibacteria group bacterium]
MIPYFELHTISLGPITIQVWGTMVALGFLVATWVAARRAKSQGIESNHIWNLAPWILFFAFVGARVFHVLFYDPSWYFVHPLDALNPALPGFSIIGGVLGGTAAGLIYVSRHKLKVWAMSDLIAYALPLGTGIGRIGCFLIHDHPGTLTHFVLGVKYPDGIRHDHGLYLSLLGWAMFILFYILGRKKHPPGYFAGLYLVIDGTVRFLLDFYRIGDAKYAGLTPTQWLLILTVTVGIWILTTKRDTVNS